MSREYTALNLQRPLSQDEIDRAVRREDSESSTSNGDSVHVKVGRNAYLRMERRWLAPAFALVLGALGLTGYRQGAFDVKAEPADRIAALESEVGTIKTVLGRLERRWLLQTLNQNQQWLWEAERAVRRDPARERYLQDEIKALNKELVGER